MVLDDLGSSLQGTLNNLRNKSRLDEEDVDEIVREIQRSLLQADVDVELVQEITNSISERALEEEPPAGTTARDHVLRIVYQELVELVGESTELELEEQTILLAGLQGSGKTTTAAKMAWWFSKKGLKPAVIQTDTFRPGAYRQADQLTDEAEVDFYGNPDSNDPVDIALNGLDETSDADVHIIDTAGRHALEQELIDEIKDIDAAVSPDNRLLVMDAAIGQKAKDQAQEFEDAIGIDGVAITKVDGTAKGGGALTAVNETGSTIAFLGNGETVRDIERFEPDGFISRLLGMGDLDKLAERVERAMEEADGEDDDWDPEQVLEGDFTLYDMRRQLETMQNLGPLDQVFDMIPGMGGGMMSQLPDDAVEHTQERLRRFEVIMDSMTEDELYNPEIIGTSRKERIARGSGAGMEEVEELLEQYRMMENALNQFGNMDRGKMEQMMDQMDGGGGGFGPF